MDKRTLIDGEYTIRVIVTERGKEPVPQFIRCRVKNGVIPSDEKTIAYLAKRENYLEGTQYTIKGISSFSDDEAERFPDVLE